MDVSKNWTSEERLKVIAVLSTGLNRRLQACNIIDAEGFSLLNSIVVLSQVEIPAAFLERNRRQMAGLYEDCLRSSR